MSQKLKIYLFAILCFFTVYLCTPMSAFANLKIQDFIDDVELSGDLRIRYEYKEKDVSDEDPTDRLRARFRLGMKWINSAENWKIAAGLATGGSDATSTNDTYSDGAFFETGDIRLDYAYAEHKMNNFKFLAGQQKNPFKTTWALWDSDIRPAGFTVKADLKPVFITAGWYDVYYTKEPNNGMAQMEAIQAGVNTDMFTAALSFYNFHDDAPEIMSEFLTDEKFGQKTTDEDGNTIYVLDYMDPDYSWQIIDFYAKCDIKTDFAKISPHVQVFYNMGAEGTKGQSIQSEPDSNGVDKYNLDPEDENMGYIVGVKAKIDKISLGIEYADIGADSCVPLLKDSDWGDALQSTDVKGFKIGLAYSVTKHCSIGCTAYLYEAKERDIDQDPKTYHVDLKYKF